ncbi:unnamed protein product [Owenia fusiformis]|uniref:Uncharacterized protein n=1 Tax=Owenia fusiformis TaxID=6347 RepID=A0A8J1T5L8_OWEFU|nr:unnamed protein product [Owenia fusiformis]
MGGCCNKGRCMCNCCVSCCMNIRHVSNAILRVFENLPIIGHIVSAIYMCLPWGNKSQAERAALKATTGLLPPISLLGFMCEWWDEVGRKKSPKTATLMFDDRTDWMGNFHDVRMENICLPGSHQSATYKVDRKLNKCLPLVEGWSQCQNLSITEQLNAGIRFLDLRIMSHENDVWCHHNIIRCVTLKEVVEDVKQFVDLHPSEIVGLHIVNDGKALAWSKTNDIIRNILGSKIVHPDNMGKTLGEITRQGGNVILFGLYEVNDRWPNLTHYWPNKQYPHQLSEDIKEAYDYCMTNRQHDLIWYKAELTPDAYIIARNIGNMVGVVVSRCADEKFEFLEDMAHAANHSVLEAMKEWTYIPFNMLCVDFVDDNIIQRIIEMNYAQAHQPRPGAATANYSVFCESNI